MQKSKLTIEGEKQYELPDGQIIKTNSENFFAPEVLFNPSLLSKEGKGLSRIIFDAVSKCELDIRLDLYKNVILSGGTCRFNGITERIKNDLSKLISDRVRLNVVNPPEAVYSSWIGGSIVSSLSTFREKWITKEMYDETGPQIALKRCQYLSSPFY